VSAHADQTPLPPPLPPPLPLLNSKCSQDTGYTATSVTARFGVPIKTEPELTVLQPPAIPMSVVQPVSAAASVHTGMRMPPSIQMPASMPAHYDQQFFFERLSEGNIFAPQNPPPLPTQQPPKFSACLFDPLEAGGDCCTPTATPTMSGRVSPATPGFLPFGGPGGIDVVPEDEENLANSSSILNRSIMQLGNSAEYWDISDSTLEDAAAEATWQLNAVPLSATLDSEESGPASRSTSTPSACDDPLSPVNGLFSNLHPAVMEGAEDLGPPVADIYSALPQEILVQEGAESCCSPIDDLFRTLSPSIMEGCEADEQLGSPLTKLYSTQPRSMMADSASSSAYVFSQYTDFDASPPLDAIMDSKRRVSEPAGKSVYELIAESHPRRRSETSSCDSPVLRGSHASAQRAPVIGSPSFGRHAPSQTPLSMGRRNSEMPSVVRQFITQVTADENPDFGNHEWCTERLEDQLKEMTALQVTEMIERLGLSQVDAATIKQYRRRLKNRGYTRVARNKARRIKNLSHTM
jgi:hypothetical protein